MLLIFRNCIEGCAQLSAQCFYCLHSTMCLREADRPSTKYLLIYLCESVVTLCGVHAGSTFLQTLGYLPNYFCLISGVTGNIYLRRGLQQKPLLPDQSSKKPCKCCENATIYLVYTLVTSFSSLATLRYLGGVISAGAAEKPCTYRSAAATPPAIGPAQYTWRKIT